MRILFLSLLSVISCLTTVYGQRYKTSTSKIHFFSSAPLEDIESTNTKSVGIFDENSQELVFVVPIKHFEFDKSLMKEHFNENYMETEKYPKANFKGKVEGFSIQEGKQSVSAVGDLTIHGVTKKVTIPGTLEKNGNKYTMHAKFDVKLADYKVEIPKIVFQNIAEVIAVTVDFEFDPYEAKK